MALHAVGKEEFYKRIHEIEKSEKEKLAEKKISEKQRIVAHKRGVHQTEERDR